MQKERLSVEQINRAVRENPAKLVEQAEHAYRAKLCSLADSLCGAPAPVKVLMLSGPSGSGKTTTANLLKDELCRRGHDATVVSLDYFFYEKDRYPRKPDGSCDYENVSAIDGKSFLNASGRYGRGKPTGFIRMIFPHRATGRSISC